MNQELIRALIDRLFELFKQQPCIETFQMIEKAREILILAETRAARFTTQKCYSKVGKNIEELPVRSNGHIFDF